MMLQAKHTCAKVYAFTLFLWALAMTFMEYYSLASCTTYFDDLASGMSGDAEKATKRLERSWKTFLLGRWAAEIYLILTTCWDAMESPVEEIDVGATPNSTV